MNRPTSSGWLLRFVSNSSGRSRSKAAFTALSNAPSRKSKPCLEFKLKNLASEERWLCLARDDELEKYCRILCDCTPDPDMLTKNHFRKKTPVLSEPAAVVDLEMSDTEYLDLLAQGRNPVREQSYTQELMAYGFTLVEAKRMASLFEKKDCSIAEKILVNRALKRIWIALTESY